MSSTRTSGIQSIQMLTADFPVTSNLTPAIIQNSATDQFVFALGALGKLYWELDGIFVLGATGGFRFQAHCTVAPTVYNFAAVITNLTTPTTFTPTSAGALAEADFANASAVASNYQIAASGLIVAAGATVFQMKFAQNSSDVLTATLKAGMRIKFWQL